MLRNTRCTPCASSAATIPSGVDSPVRFCPSVRLGLNVCSAPSAARIRSAFVTETGSAKSGALQCVPSQVMVSAVRLPSSTTAAALLSTSRWRWRYAGVMAAEMSVSHRPSCISPRSSVM